MECLLKDTVVAQACGNFLSSSVSGPRQVQMILLRT